MTSSEQEIEPALLFVHLETTQHQKPTSVAVRYDGTKEAVGGFGIYGKQQQMGLSSFMKSAVLQSIRRRVVQVCSVFCYADRCGSAESIQACMVRGRYLNRPGYPGRKGDRAHSNNNKVGERKGECRLYAPRFDAPGQALHTATHRRATLVLL